MSTFELPATSDGSPDSFDVLSDARRRQILSILFETDGPLALADLAREVLARKRETPTEIDQGRLRQCYLALYHNHVPKLAETGIVEFDVGRRTVALDVSSDPTERLGKDRTPRK